MNNEIRQPIREIEESEIAPIFEDPNKPHSDNGTLNVAANFQNTEQTYQDISKKRKISAFKLIIIFALIPIIVTVSAHSPAFWKRVSYWWTTEYQTVENPPSDSPLAFIPSEEAVSFETDDILYIPKINVSAPIIWDVPGGKILDELKNGVAHYMGTAKPGEGGNVFLVGHSSGYFWEGRYTEIFTLLDKLVIGDRIYLKTNGEEYTYQVSEILIINPKQTEVLEPTSEPILSLMTCAPVGTNFKRLVARAKQLN